MRGNRRSWTGKTVNGYGYDHAWPCFERSNIMTHHCVKGEIFEMASDRTRGRDKRVCGVCFLQEKRIIASYRIIVIHYRILFFCSTQKECEQGKDSGLGLGWVPGVLGIWFGLLGNGNGNGNGHENIGAGKGYGSWDGYGVWGWMGLDEFGWASN